MNGYVNTLLQNFSKKISPLNSGTVAVLYPQLCYTVIACDNKKKTAAAVSFLLSLFAYRSERNHNRVVALRVRKIENVYAAAHITAAFDDSDFVRGFERVEYLFNRIEIVHGLAYGAEHIVVTHLNIVHAERYFPRFFASSMYFE